MSAEDLLKTVLEFVAICVLVYCFYKEEEIIEFEDQIASIVTSRVKTLMNTIKNERKSTNRKRSKNASRRGKI